MRLLLKRLMARRDYYLALAGRFSELVAFVENDFGLATGTHKAKRAIMNGARVKFDQLTAPRTAHEALLLGLEASPLTDEGEGVIAVARPKRYKLSEAARRKASKRMSRHMKKLWRDPAMRKKLLRAAKRGNRTRTRNAAASIVSPAAAAHTAEVK